MEWQQATNGYWTSSSIDGIQWFVMPGTPVAIIRRDGIYSVRLGTTFQTVDAAKEYIEAKYKGV